MIEMKCKQISSSPPRTWGEMGDAERVKEALRLMEFATGLYRRYADSSSDPRVKEMFREMAQTESARAAMLRETLRLAR